METLYILQYTMQYIVVYSVILHSESCLVCNLLSSKYFFVEVNTINIFALSRWILPNFSFFVNIT